MRLCFIPWSYCRLSFARWPETLNRGVRAGLLPLSISRGIGGTASASSHHEPLAPPSSSLSHAILASKHAQPLYLNAAAQSVNGDSSVFVKPLATAQLLQSLRNDQLASKIDPMAPCVTLVPASTKHGSKDGQPGKASRDVHCAETELEEQEDFLHAVQQWLQHLNSEYDTPAHLITQQAQQRRLSARLVSETIQHMLLEIDRRSSPDDSSHRIVIEAEMIKVWFIAATGCNYAERSPHLAAAATIPMWPDVSEGLFQRLLQPVHRSDGASRIRALWSNLSQEIAGALFLSAIDMFAHFAKLGRPGMQGHAQNFLVFTSRVLFKADLSAHRNRSVLSSSAYEALMSDIDLRCHSLIAMQLSRLRLTDAQDLCDQTILSRAVEEYFINSLGRMHERGRYRDFDFSFRIARTTFRLLHEFYGSRDQTDPFCATMPNTLSRMFLLTAFRWNNLDAANYIWQYMCQIPHYRTVKDWTVMMHGIGALKGIQAVNELWQSMLGHAIEPDTAAWNVRIRAEILFGRFDYAMQLLELMSEQAEVSTHELPSSTSSANVDNTKIDVSKRFVPEHTIATPNTRTLNAALAAMRQPTLPQIKLLLNWASSVGIAYDVYTYNVLLTTYAKLGDYTAFSDTITSMRKHGVNPDAVTFNLLTDHYIETSTNYAQQTVDVIVQHVQVMRSMSLQPNIVLLAKLLETLLFVGDPHAAQELLQLSKQIGRSIHARLCATMVKGLFKHSYRDTSSIERMVLEIDAAQGGIGSDFYDAAVQGLADRREIRRMQTHFTSAIRLGLTLSWRTRYLSLKASIASGDHQVARDIIDHTSKSVVHGGAEQNTRDFQNTSQQYEHQFWSLVKNFQRAT